MKTTITVLAMINLLILASSSFAAKILEGEAEFISRFSGSIYVDYIVSDADLGIGIPDVSFIFSTVNGSSPPFKGDKSGYDASTYFYYYQLENYSGTSLTTIKQLTLNIFDPLTVVSAGFITDTDLDDIATFDHNIVGDHEDDVAVRDSDSSDFDELSIPRNQTWAFEPTELAIGAESAVFFVTCLHPPVFAPAFALNGSIFEGELPIPMRPIPEPLSMVLISGSLIGLYIRKRARK